MPIDRIFALVDRRATATWGRGRIDFWSLHPTMTGYGTSEGHPWNSIIVPAFYRTAWFRTTCSITLLALVWIFIDFGSDISQGIRSSWPQSMQTWHFNRRKKKSRGGSYRSADGTDTSQPGYPRRRDRSRHRSRNEPALRGRRHQCKYGAALAGSPPPENRRSAPSPCSAFSAIASVRRRSSVESARSLADLLYARNRWTLMNNK